MCLLSHLWFVTYKDGVIKTGTFRSIDGYLFSDNQRMFPLGHQVSQETHDHSQHQFSATWNKISRKNNKNISK